MSRLTHLSLLLGLWSAVGTAWPQEIEPPIVSARTDVVTLVVTVVDRKGTHVTGLRPEHFTVYDNGEPQAIQFFTSEDLPATIGLVVDSSGSTRNRRDEVTAAAMAFATISHPNGEFFIVNFNETVWPGLPPGVLFTDDTSLLRAALSAAPAQGMTALYDAVDRALDHLQHGRWDRKALIVVSDGGDNASSRTLDTVLEHARRADAVIYAVTLFDPDNREANPRVLKTLARETGGRAFAPGPGKDVAESVAEIAREIRSGYLIGFAPVETSDGGYRSLRVAVNAGDDRPLMARTRAGYYAAPTRRTIR
jgi:Ca-activated chloride channel family protein